MVHYTELPIHKNSKFKVINWIDSCNVNNLTSSHTFIDKSEGKCVCRLMTFQDNVISLGRVAKWPWLIFCLIETGGEGVGGESEKSGFWAFFVSY